MFLYLLLKQRNGRISNVPLGEFLLSISLLLWIPSMSIYFSSIYDIAFYRALFVTDVEGAQPRKLAIQRDLTIFLLLTCITRVSPSPHDAPRTSGVVFPPMTLPPWHLTCVRGSSCLGNMGGLKGRTPGMKGGFDGFSIAHSLDPLGAVPLANLPGFLGTES